MIKALIARPRLKFISVEKLPDIRANEGVGPYRKNKLQNESYDGVNTKLHASKDSDGKEFERGYAMFC